MRILILCTGNSCRSQMAHGFLQSFDNTLEIYSAGTQPAEQVNPKAITVMQEIGIDISSHTPTTFYCSVVSPYSCITLLMSAASAGAKIDLCCSVL